MLRLALRRVGRTGLYYKLEIFFAVRSRIFMLMEQPSIPQVEYSSLCAVGYSCLMDRPPLSYLFLYYSVVVHTGVAVLIGAAVSVLMRMVISISVGLSYKHHHNLVYNSFIVMIVVW